MFTILYMKRLRIIICILALIIVVQAVPARVEGELWLGPLQEFIDYFNTEIDLTGGSVDFSSLDTDCTCKAVNYDNMISYVPLGDTPPFDDYTFLNWEYNVYLSGNFGGENAVYCSIEFVSGEEKLRGALTLKEDQYTTRDADGNQTTEKCIRLVNKAEHYVPGEAVFHFRAAGKTFLFEKDITLTVLTWDAEHPAVRMKENPTVTVKTGSLVSDRMVLDQMVELDLAAVQEVLDRRGEDQELTNDTVAGWIRGDFTKAAEEGGLILERIPVGKKEQNFLRTLKPGEYIYNVRCNYFGIHFNRDCTIRVVSYGPDGPTEAWAGETVHYNAADDEEGSCRTFTFSAEGEGVSIDSETGLLTIAPDILNGTPYLVTVTPSDGGPASSLTCAVKALTPEKIQSEPFELGEGFTVPVFADRNRFKLIKASDENYNVIYVCTDEDAKDLPYTTHEQFGLQWYNSDLMESNQEGALYAYESFADSYYGNGYEYQEFEIDGHSAWMVILNTEKYHSGMVIYGRNRYLSVITMFYIRRGSGSGDWPEMTFDDLMPLTDRITYDSSKASFTEEMAKCTLVIKEGTNVVAAGKQLHITDTYADDKAIKKLIQKSGKPVNWYVYSEDEGKEVDGITISNKGVLSVSRNITEPYEMTVQTAQITYGLIGRTSILVTPAETALAVEPKELVFETTVDAPLTVTASWEPVFIPAAAFTWKTSKDGYVEIAPAEDGSVTVRPLKKGTVNLTVTGPGGKKATVKIAIKSN